MCLTYESAPLSFKQRCHDALADVLLASNSAHGGVARRFTSGIAHFIAKSLPQRSIVRVADRTSMALVDNKHTQEYLRIAVTQLVPQLNTQLNAVANFAAFVRRNFKVVLSGIRLLCVHTLDDSPGLTMLAQTVMNLRELRASVAQATAFVQRHVDVTQACANRALHECMSVVVSVATMAVPIDRRALVNMIVPVVGPLTTPAQIDQAHALHAWCVLHEQRHGGRYLLAAAMRAARVPPQVVARLLGVPRLKRRLRRAAVRAAVEAVTRAGTTALQNLRVVAHALSRALNVRLSYTRREDMSDAHAAPCSSASAYFCCVCNSLRCSLTCRGGNRILFDYETHALSCGKRSRTRGVCADTPLVSVKLTPHACLEAYGKTYSSCTLCGNLFLVTRNAWRKSVFACGPCFHRIAVVACATDCDACRATLPSLRFDRAHDVYVLSRACARHATFVEPSVNAAATVADAAQ